MSNDNKPVVSSRKDVDLFLKKVAKTPALHKDGTSGRLIFAMDATASREPTWDQACHLHGQMFSATKDIGSLLVQLCYYRGFNQFKSSRWCHSPEDLLEEMTSVRCLGGYTQIHKVLAHAKTEHATNKVRAVVFVGDALEEDADKLCHMAGQLGMLNLPVFMFQEGNDTPVRSVFQQIAHLSGGAYAPFNLASAAELKDLLSAVAVYATGGKAALAKIGRNRGAVALLTQQLNK